MPVSLPKFGIEQNKKQRDRVNQMIGDTGQIGGLLIEEFDQLDGGIVSFLIDLSRKVVVNQKLDEIEWNRISRKTINKSINIPFDRFVRRTSTLANKFQELGFKESDKDLVSLFRSIYPVKVQTVTPKRFRMDLEALDFANPDLELEFLKTGREVQESVGEIDTFSEELRNMIVCDVEESETDLSELIVEEAGSQFLRLNVGTGNSKVDFKMFLKRQLQAGLDPANFIRTISTQHVALMQGILLDNINKGLGIRETRKAFVNKVSGALTTGVERERLMKNSMRILRTAHQRASASAVSLFALRNRDLITGLRRVANGRPCIACFPPGHRVSTPYNGQVPIEKLKRLQTVYNGHGIKDEIEMTHEHDYEGDLIRIKFEGGQMSPTPYHEIYVLRNGKEMKVRADEVKVGDELVEQLHHA